MIELAHHLPCFLGYLWNLLPLLIYLRGHVPNFDLVQAEMKTWQKDEADWKQVQVLGKKA